MQHARTSGHGSVVQALKSTCFTASDEACRQPARMRAERMRWLGAIAVRKSVTCGWISCTSAAAAGET